MSELDDRFLELAGSKSPARRNAAMRNEDEGRERRPRLLQKLVRAGADPDARDGFDGANAVHILGQLGDLPSLDVVVELGADPHAVDRDGNLALHVVAETGDVDTLEHLLDLGLDPNGRNLNEKTPLHDWAFRGTPGGVRLLLERGAAVDARRDDGNTPLHMAAVAGQEDNVRTLLDFGADLGVRNDSDQTALDLARHYDRWAVAKILDDLTPATPTGPSDPVDHFVQLAEQYGEQAARRALTSGDWDSYIEDDLEPEDLADDYWTSNYLLLAERELDDADASNVRSRRDVLDAMWESYRRAFVATAPRW